MKKIFFILLCFLPFTAVDGQLVRANHFYSTAVSGGGEIPPESSTLLTSLVAYWKLDEVSGSANDEVGTADGAIGTNVTQHVAGKLGFACQFAVYTQPNTVSGVRVGTPAVLSLTTQGTVSAWVYQTAGDWFEGVVAGDYDNDSELNGYALELTYLAGSGTTVMRASFGSGATRQYSTGTTQIAVDTWYLLTVAWNSTTVNLYINGSLEKSEARTVTPVSGVNDFCIGRSPSEYSPLPFGYTSYPGSIDEVAVWNRTLSLQGVDSLYNAGVGKTHPFN